ncbi:MAG: hypothetical protein E3K32_02250 [wastewater metagenome]|nr:hypothetical protein [Candidatus Loosdrechtia aerotolerans]
MKKAIIPVIIFSCICTSCVLSKYTPYQNTKFTSNREFAGTEMIRQEFETIRRVLRVLEKATDCLDNGQQIPAETFQGILEIISNFSDKRHHEKEDKILFPILKDKENGAKRDFLGQLLMEHVTSRDKIRDLSGSLIHLSQGKKAKKKITKIAYAYIKHTRRHIQTEEKVLLPWANTVLTHDDQILLKNTFGELERDDIETGVHEKYITMLEGFEKQLEIHPES